MSGSIALLLAIIMSLPIHQQMDAGDGWDSWKFLVGDWEGEGSGQPGQGSGAFSFHFDLKGKVLIRRNRTDYPATQDRPAFSHQDLMVVYPGAGGAHKRAIYFDNEGHVIQYTAEFSQDHKSLVFLSDLVPSAPRFRLTYTKGKNDRLIITFEIAPPGKPGSFSTHLEGEARRQAAH